MDMPGLSIFRGGGSIKVDTSINRAEEEEALEDQRRRNEELGNQLQNAFDDLLDDEDCTIDTSADIHSQYQPVQHNAGYKATAAEGQDRKFHYQHLLEGNPEGQKNAEKDREMEKLKMSIETRAREVENLTKLLHDEKKASEELRKRLALSEAEKERAKMTASQTHELLVDSKSKISEMDANMHKLESSIKTLEEKNKELVGELERTKLQLSDAQHKYRAVERNASYSADMRAENLVKNANERHIAQTMVLQQQIDSLRNKLDAKEKEYASLDVRYQELQRSREVILIEKSEVINQLTRSLEEAQRRYQDTVSNNSENRRLQDLVRRLERQTEDMQKTITDLMSRSEGVATELNSIEELLQESLETSGSQRRKSLSKSDLVRNDPVVVHCHLIRLRERLHHCFSKQKERNEELLKLREQVNKQTEEMNKLRASENSALIEITTTREENLRLNNRLRLLETELKEVQGEKGKEDAAAEDLQLELDRMREENVTTSNELAIARNELETLKRRNSELQAEINNLLEGLKSKSESDKLISSLKEKARQFEEYIRNENVSNRTAKASPRLQDRAVSTSPELDRDYSDASYRCKIESEIRGEMAKIFATKIKSMEDMLQNKCHELEAQNLQLQQNLRLIYNELQIREKEVDVLKHAILKEREKMHEIADTQTVQMHQINATLEKCRDELKLKQKNIERLHHELQERSTLIESERRSMKTVMAHWDEQQREYDRTTKELKAKLEKIQQQHRESLEALNSKYNSAKKTAANYKKYAEDKEKFMLEQYERIKSSYEAKLNEMVSSLEKQRKQIKAKTMEREAACRDERKELDPSPNPDIPSL